MEIPQIILETAQNLFNGLAIGSVIALAAVGLTLTCGILRLSNFAHGDFMTLGAYLTWLLNSQGLNLVLSAILGAGGTIFAMLVSSGNFHHPDFYFYWFGPVSSQRNFNDLGG